MAEGAIHPTIDAVWRMESAKIIGGLARLTRDVGLAEELAQDALVVALETWPASGIPENPAAWLTLTAKRRALDRLRRGRMLERKHAEIARELSALQDLASADLEPSGGADVGDDVLRLIFTACHPVLRPEARVALTLRVLGGLSTEEIARAFLVSEATAAQRIVRAKRALAEADVPFEVPRGEERGARLESVLEVLYLIFNEGYAATAGPEWTRPALCDEAMRLGRILAGLMPDEPEAHGLLALMEFQASRLRARTGADGEPVLLLDQDRTRWDRLLIGHGLLALERALRLDGPKGPYTIQAAIAACHARATEARLTDWSTIAALYRALEARAPSPVVRLNLAMAIAMSEGPAEGLRLIDELAAEETLRLYPHLPAARADLLAKLGRFAEARAQFERAASLTRNESERRTLLRRAADCGARAAAS